MNLNPQLLDHLKEMSQAEQELLLVSLTAKNENFIGMSQEEIVDAKDNLAYLAFAALENDVPPKVVFNGAFRIWNQLYNQC